MRHYADPVPHGTTSRIAFFGHPAHAMMVPFPIAFLMAVLASDIAWWHWSDPFWARVSLWLAGGGAVMGVLAGMAGTAELLFVRDIRRRAAAWSHFVVAIMLLSVAVANWGLRVEDAQARILPWGIYLSALGAGLVAVAGWLGGTLVFEHQVGIIDADEED